MLDSAAIKIILQGVSQDHRLESIKLNRNKLEIDGFKELFDTLEKTKQSIKHLEFEQLELTEAHLLRLL